MDAIKLYSEWSMLPDAKKLLKLLRSQFLMADLI